MGGKMKKIPMVFLTLVFLGLALACCVIISEPMTKLDLSGRYRKIEYNARSLKILEKVNVRAEPIVIQDNANGDSNSFGMTKESGFTIEITRFYKTDVELDSNGAFYGFLAEEILSTPEGRKWIPNRIKEDPDGIIWINAEYIEVS